MIVTPSRELIDRVFFELQPISIGGASLYVLYRISATNAGWQVATIQEETTASVAIVGLPSGETYDFQLRYTHPNYLSSPATTVTSHYVAGRTTAPAVLRNLSLAIVGGQALLMWALPAEIDVQYGGWVMFRHSPDMDATLWPNSTSLAQAVVGEQTHVYMPLKPGTYFARTYDADGRASTDFASVSTKQASLLAFSPVGGIVEDPLFTGAKTNCKLVSDYLTLTADTFDTVPDVSLLASWGVSGGSAEAGQYNFAVGMDLGSVKRCRVTSHVNVEAINENDYWDAKIGADRQLAGYRRHARRGRRRARLGQGGGHGSRFDGLVPDPVQTYRRDGDQRPLPRFPAPPHDLRKPVLQPARDRAAADCRRGRLIRRQAPGTRHQEPETRNQKGVRLR